MKLSKFNKLKYSRIFCLLFVSMFLFGGFPGIIKENIIDINAQTTSAIFAGRIGSVIPLATCANPYTSYACINCQQGSWDDITILTVFGGDTTVETYACKMASFVPNGGGTCQINEVIFGPGVANQLSTNDGKTTNIWCQMQTQ